MARFRRLACRGFAVAVLFSCNSSNGNGNSDPGTSDDAGTSDAGTVDAGTARPWNANEVSILFPLPTDRARLLSMRNAMDAGEQALLPEELFHRLGAGALPRLIEAAGDRDLYPDLRVVSARLDPCFDGPSPIDGSCKRQVRLVAQALDPTLISFSDAAIHLFYDVDEAHFIDALARLRALSRATPVTGPLGVHPILSRDALVGPFADEIRSIIVSACGVTNLTRFTFMATGRSKNWFFFILDRQSDGSFVQSNVVGRGDSDSFTDQGLKSYRTGVPFGVTWFPDSLLATDTTRGLTAPAFGAAYDQLAKLTNPLLTHTRDVSCGACHVAESTRVESLRDRDAVAPAASPSAYAPPRSTTYLLGNLHAFSYFVDAPAVSERTTNETEEVLRSLGSSAFLQSLSPGDRARLE